MQVNYLTDGPVIISFSLAEGQEINRPIDIEGEASAVLGLSALEFYVDDVLLASAVNGTLSYRWDVRETGSGIRRVKLVARDMAGNIATSEKNVVLQLTPPASPVITEPADGLIVTTGSVTVRGTAEPFVTVCLTGDGFVVAAPVAGSDGTFEVADIHLIEGSNEFVAIAEDCVGVSANSNTVTVILDSGSPEAPVLGDIYPTPGIGIAIEWQFAETGERPPRFSLYRHTSPFSDTSEATQIASNLTAMNYTDTGISDGTYFYALVGVDDAGNESLLSNLVSILYDSTSPSFTLSFGQTPPVGTGLLDITLTTSEALAITPSLTITPAGALSPVSVGLNRENDFTYTGNLEILGDTPSGTASVFVSGQDMTGNIFSGVPSGEDLVIDTDSPSGSIAANPAEPIQVLGSVNVNVSLTLSEPEKLGSIPTLQFTPPTGSPVNVVLVGSDAAWSGVLPLEPAMGSGFGQFTLQSEDALGNIGTAITSGSSLEIYTTATPNPTDPPENMAGSSLPGGQVQISWSADDRADTYNLYRKSGICDATPSELVAEDLTDTEYIDLPPDDGVYCYGTTTDRKGAESSISGLVAVLSDRTLPEGPENVAVSLENDGVHLSWKGPSSGDTPAGYFVYRNGARIRTITESSASYEIIDHPGTGTDYSYVVASFDAVGNEAQSLPVVQNLIVGAVTNLQVFVNNDNAPLLTWDSDDLNVVGFNVYKGGIKINDTLLTGPEFEDIFYAGASLVEYEVRAVNGDDDQGPSRILRVLPVTFAAATNPDENGDTQPLVTNYFNTIDVSVTNDETMESFQLDHIEHRITVNDEEPFLFDHEIGLTIPAKSDYVDSIVFPVGTSTDDLVLRITVTDIDEDGGTVIYQRHIVLANVVQPDVMVEMMTDALPLAGGYSTINLCVNNNGYADMDIIVNRSNGQEPGDIYVSIINSEGLEISRAYYKGFPPGTNVTSSGTGYVTIGSDESLCVDIQVPVPANLEEGSILAFVGAVEEFFYDLIGANRSGHGELTGSMESGITFSEYYGTAQTDKDVYTGDEVITISGQSINRETGLPEPDVPLKIGFYMRGYRWFEEITTDGNGDYTFEYSPTNGISGEFIISAAHPDVYDVLDQDRFRLYRLYARPTSVQINMGKADTVDFRIGLFNPGDTQLTGFTFQFRAYTVDGQGTEVDESRVQGQVDFGTDFYVKPGDTRTINMQLSAYIDAPDDVNIEYTMVSSEGASVVFPGSVTLMPAVPMLAVDEPQAGYVDVSVNQGDMVTVPVTIKNNGVEDLLDAEITLPQNVAWMTTNLPRNPDGKAVLGNIKAGRDRTFDVVIAPPSDAEFGYHNDTMIITGSNTAEQFSIDLFALVSTDVTGSVLFKVVNFIGQEVKGAYIRMVNPAIYEKTEPVRTDENGEVTISHLQVGRWSYSITSPGHSTETGVVNVVAGQTVLEEVFPTKSLVSISFSVVPVPYTDRYEVKLEQEFETHVPFPVLVIDPPVLSYKDVTPGSVIEFIVKMTNHGLIQLEDVIISPDEDRNVRLDPLITYVPALKPFETIEVPYRVTYTAPSESLPGGLIEYYKEIKKCTEFDIAEQVINMAIVTSKASGFGPCRLTKKTRETLEGYARAQAAFPVILETLVKVGSKIPGLGKVIEVWQKVYPKAKLISCTLKVLFKESEQTKTEEEKKDGDSEEHEETSTPSEWFYSLLLDEDKKTTKNGSYNFPSSMPKVTDKSNPPCFTAGTPIRMSDGSQQTIETVKVGDMVMALDGSPARVSRTYVRESDHMREIRYRVTGSSGLNAVDSLPQADIRRLETTDEHLFWVEGNEWMPAFRTNTGDIIILADGKKAELLSSERFELPTIVYNFDVEGYESYFANDAFVYQECGGRPDDPVSNWIRQFLGNWGEPESKLRLNDNGSRALIDLQEQERGSGEDIKW